MGKTVRVQRERDGYIITIALTRGASASMRISSTFHGEPGISVEAKCLSTSGYVSFAVAVESLFADGWQFGEMVESLYPEGGDWTARQKWLSGAD